MRSEDDDNGFAQWGGYMGAKITKLEEQFAAASDHVQKTNLFKDISIYVNGLTNPSADQLKRIMMVHGGVFHHYERTHTSFIIAANLPDVKVRNMNTSKIISAQWVVDCVNQQQLLDYSKYLLYTNQKTTQPRITFSKSSANSTNDHQVSKFEGLPSNASKVNDATPKKDCNIDSNNNSPMRTIEGLNHEDIFKELQELQIRIHECVPTKSDSRKPLEEKPLNISAAKSKAARTAVDPDFLQEFYNNSRLHHISTLGAGFKQYISELRAKHESEIGFLARKELKSRIPKNSLVPVSYKPLTTCVMHIDMDCFFVSVGLRNHPELRGMPVAVTHSKGGSGAMDVPVHPQANRQVEMELFKKRFDQHLHDNIRSDKVRTGFEPKMSLSEIASCSYEARAKGIRNGMFVGAALKLCPDLKTIPYDFEGYREVAFTLYNTVTQYTLNIEAVSCDEMFVELTDVLSELQVAPLDFVSALRTEVRQKTGCPCSAGVGANKLQARMATKRAKPDGQFLLNLENVEAYMAPISIEELPGIGSASAYTLKQAKLFTCGDLQNVSLAKIQMHLGKKLGQIVHQYCRGFDNRQLVFDQVRKSVSSEVNYGIRFKNYGDCETFLIQLSKEVHTRLQDINRRAKCVTLKLMVRAQDAPIETSKFMGHGVCDNYSKSTTLPEFTNDLDKITQTVLTIMKSMSTAPQELRGIGIQLSKLDEPLQHSIKRENAIKNMFSKVCEKQKEKPPIISVESSKFAVNEEQNLPPQAGGGKTDQSIAVRKRGRPPKISPPSKQVAKKQPNVLNMLQNAAVVNKRKIYAPLPSDIDPEVLAELPEDIRNEIIKEHAIKVAKVPAMRSPAKMQAAPLNESDLQPSTSKAAAEKRIRIEYSVQNAKPATLQADPQFLAALPPDVRKEVEEDLLTHIGVNENPATRPTVTPSPAKNSSSAVQEENEKNVDNLFLNKDFIKVILGWVKVQQQPFDYDIDMVSNNACEMVEMARLDELYNGMLYLCRLINSHRGSTEFCGWHLAYKMIEAAIQLQMRLSHNGRLLKLGDQLNCKECKL